MVKELQRIYLSEGVSINNKHIEVVVRQMFSRVRVVSAGDTNLIPSEIIDKSKLYEINRGMKESGKEPARGEELLLGVAKAALSADGWLSAASFQETARVLVKAASEGRVDYLRGLKENVIIGRLLPIGRTLRNAGETPEKTEEE